MMRRFEFNDGVSSKFWEIEQAGDALHIGFGKIGTAGQRQSKNHAGAARAAAAMAKLIGEKTAKGYAETSAATAAVATAAAATPAAVKAVAPRAAPVTPAAPGDAPPWLDADPQFELTPALAAHALPSRRHPGPPPSTDGDARWALFLERVRAHCVLRATGCDASLKEGVIEAITRIAKGKRLGSPASDVILLATEIINEKQRPASEGCPFIDVLVADKGLAYAFDILIMLQRVGIEEQSRWSAESWNKVETREAGPFALYGLTQLGLRAHLAHAPQALWEQAVQRAREAAGALPSRSLPLLAALLPDAPQLANELALMLAPEPDYEGGRWWCCNYSWLIAYATSPEARQALRLWPPHQRLSPRDFDSSLMSVATALRDRGPEALEALEGGRGADAAQQALACIGTPEALRALAWGYGENWFTHMCAAGQRWPDAAMAALSELIGKDHCGPGGARAALASVVATHAHRVPALKPWISAPAWEVLSVAAAQYLGGRDCADPSELPLVLAAPPWRQPAMQEAQPFALAALALDPVVRWSEAERERVAADGYRYQDYLVRRQYPMAGAVRAVDDIDTDGSLAPWVDCLDPNECLQEQARAIADLPAPMNARVWNALAHMGMTRPGYAIARLGVDALPALVDMFTSAPTREMEYVQYFGAVDLAAPVARAYATLKSKALLAQARAWLLDFPEHAACGLIAPALGQAGVERDHARQSLRVLAAAGHADLLLDVAARYRQPDVSAAMRAMLGQSPLQRYPARIGKLPAFWTALVWTRPLLAASGKALPDDAMDAIGVMLRFPHADGVYAGVGELKQACTPDSLAAFAWDLFRAWTDDGAKGKEIWAFHALGLLGNDESARRLTRLLRDWPGQGLHARAVVGLDVLALIGSDIALMLLNGVAQKLKFKALQDRAQEKIKEIAEARGLASDELEDRLAPDLGLDEQGALLLDFGPRQFRVGFDETLAPFVRAADGKRSADLPKPKKSDDADLATAAVKRFKLLKKDARTIAGQQVLRLELAMCAQRRWPVRVFYDCMVAHPLVRHLAQRLVWGVYDANGGQLQACFRVTPEGALSDANDDAFVLAQDAVVGIAHALALAPADADAFARLFADYELLQPFAQIGRDTYTLDDLEKKHHALGRWNGTVVPTASLLGLLNQGWRRGKMQDGGTIWQIVKVLGSGYTATLDFAPGIMVGMPGDSAEQTLGGVVIACAGQAGMRPSVPLASLDTAATSELIRELVRLCA
ncbi:DUF4132 domain-containing protein [Massilia sp. DJPM01]|uniref:DUF4132 domain-containing protein n=1 Tax=Massilia sp. DJPM01 TaxID=3024404 RepID=UPI00259D6E41|nr:DUF4132 domain-containing protein [Massilia sp. DJPM01]MDM5178370.1 DUF4132 domain-containing protein [Massilia sp. DJPM01]